MSRFKILMVASEVAPLAKTGGLADMVAGLSSALVELGHDVRVILPCYQSVERSAQGLEPVHSFVISDGEGTRSVTAEQIRIRPLGSRHSPRTRFYALRQDEYFSRRGIYQDSGQDYPDNLARFAFFSRAALELVSIWERTEAWVPDVIHAHDWQAALVPVYLRTTFAARSFASVSRSILTLHNVGYQGIFPADEFPSLGLEGSHFTPQGLEFYGSINLLKGGIIHADSLTTVSPTYCREIQTPEYGFGLDGVLRERRDRLVGIVNGIDTDLWDPASDPWLPANYSVSDPAGKAKCKSALQDECGLPVGESPLFAVVSRLVSQKGIDLVIGAAPLITEGSGQLVVLGAGDADLEADLQSLERRFPQQIKVIVSFDERLAHRIQAGADAFLVPSRYEPCGLTQLCSLRYGTVPIVRRTGGLADTVEGVSASMLNLESATGFVFEQPTVSALGESIRRALRTYANEAIWHQLIRQGMMKDVSWQESARRYLEIYHRTCGRS